MAKKKLTMKQEGFCRSIVKGLSQREAYKKNYSTKNMSEKSIDNEASRLMKNPEVSLRLSELRERLDLSAIMTAEERLKYLTKIVRGTEGEESILSVGDEMLVIEGPVSVKNKLNAIDIMNRMEGEYTTKIDANVTTKLEDLLKED